jgi:hypothetical protein
MAPTAAQFSPGQILDAGRRAENDGRVGYAIQFYRHLTDNHAWSPEAAIAKEALARLQNFQPTADAATGAPQHAQQRTQPQPNWGQSPQGNIAGHGAMNAGVMNGGTMNGSRPHAVAAPPVAPQSARAAATNGHPHAIPGEASTQPLRLPEAERRYRIGSIVAWLLFSIGLLFMVASLILIGLHTANIKLPGTLGMLLGFTGGFPGAFAIFTVGVMQVFAAQIGRALFDNANAMRDLAMIERAKIAHAAGDKPFGDDEDEPA